MSIIELSLLITTIYLLGVVFTFKASINYFYNWIASVVDDVELRKMMRASFISWPLYLCVKYSNYLQNKNHGK